MLILPYYSSSKFYNPKNSAKVTRVLRCCNWNAVGTNQFDCHTVSSLPNYRGAVGRKLFAGTTLDYILTVATFGTVWKQIFNYRFLSQIASPKVWLRFVCEWENANQSAVGWKKFQVCWFFSFDTCFILALDAWHFCSHFMVVPQN